MEIDEIVDLYYKKIYKLCLFYLKDKEEAEELLQDIFMKVVKKNASFKGEAERYTWLYRVAVNTLLNHIKRKKIVRFLSLEALFESNSHFNGEGQSATGTNPAEILETEELNHKKRQLLTACLERLSPREKTAFYFFHYDGLRHKEIAAIMDTSVSAVEALIHKGIKKLKTCAGQKSLPE